MGSFLTAFQYQMTLIVLTRRKKNYNKVDYAVPVDTRMKGKVKVKMKEKVKMNVKEWKKQDKYLDLGRELKRPW